MFSLSHRGFLFHYPIFLCFFLVLIGFNACAPLDQRYFDPQAGLPPKGAFLKPPYQDNHDIKKSFIEIIEGTSEKTYGPAVESAAKIALQRKNNILFIVEALIPPTTADQQITHLEKINQDLLLPITYHLRAAGAQPIQIDMRSATDLTIHHAVVRINVR